MLGDWQSLMSNRNVSRRTCQNQEHSDETTPLFNLSKDDEFINAITYLPVTWIYIFIITTNAA